MVPLLLCAAIVLIAGLAFNLAYLDTGGEKLPAPPGSGSPNPGAGGILDSNSAATILLVCFAAIVVLSIVFVILTRRKGLPVRRILRPSSWFDIVAMLIAFLVFGLILVLWPRIVAAVSRPTTSGTGNPNLSGNSSALPSVSGIPLGVFLIAAVVVSVLAIALTFRLGAELMRPLPDRRRSGPRREAALVLQTAIEQLQLGGDVREVILACYARFCVLLGARGIAAQEALTPRELEDLAVRRLSVSADSSDALTSLFEEARYSEHTLADADRNRAVASLERIRTDLEV